MPASFTRAQNGSNSRSPGERPPNIPGTGAGRIPTTLAPRSNATSNSLTASVTSDRLIMATGYKRSLLEKPHSSSIQLFNDENKLAIASGLCPSLASTTDAKVGKTIDAWTPCSSNSSNFPRPVRHCSGGERGLPLNSRIDKPSVF